MLRQIYDLWQAGNIQDGDTPLLDRFADLPEEAAAHTWLAEVQQGGGFRFLRVGHALEQRLGRPLSGISVEVTQADGGDVFRLIGGTLSAAYRRCAESGSPFYDYARFSTGEDGGAMLFERLVLPLFAGGGQVTHLLGVAVFTELPGQSAPDEARDPPATGT